MSHPPRGVRRPESRPLVVGIVNVTPDSFYDGGRHAGGSAIEHARSLVEQGADWLDIGGESTRPGAAPVDADEEIRRVLPVIEALAGTVPLSIDTSKAVVAARALAAGAEIINDVTGLGDREMPAVTADARVTVVMHMRGTPRDMGQRTTYGDLVEDVRAWLLERAELARSEEVWIDPGIGFAKTAEQSLSLLKHTARLADAGRPVLIGASRKSFIGHVLGLSDPDDRLPGSLGAVAAAYHGGAAGFRVHDVSATRALLDLVCAVRAAR